MDHVREREEAWLRALPRPVHLKGFAYGLDFQSAPARAAADALIAALRELRPSHVVFDGDAFCDTGFTQLLLRIAAPAPGRPVGERESAGGGERRRGRAAAAGPSAAASGAHGQAARTTADEAADGAAPELVCVLMDGHEAHANTLESYAGLGVLLHVVRLPFDAGGDAGDGGSSLFEAHGQRALALTGAQHVLCLGGGQCLVAEQALSPHVAFRVFAASRRRRDGRLEPPALPCVHP